MGHSWGNLEDSNAERNIHRGDQAPKVSDKTGLGAIYVINLLGICFHSAHVLRTGVKLSLKIRD